MRGSRNFCWGGGGPDLSTKKQPGQPFFSPQFNSLQRGSNGFITENTIFFQIQRGFNIFWGGGGGEGHPNFPGGSKC